MTNAAGHYTFNGLIPGAQGRYLYPAVTAVGLLVGVGYATVVRRHLDVVATALDKPAMVDEAEGFWARLNARLLGWKTIILAAVAAVTQAVPAFLDAYLPTIKDAPWAQVVDGKVASWISFGCVLLIPLTHAIGLSKAAVTPPSG